MSECTRCDRFAVVARRLVLFWVIAALAVVVASAAAAAPAQVRETSVTIPTYAYGAAKYTPSPLNKPEMYPYPRVKLHEVAPSPEDMEYRALILENDWLRLTILPELGGRIWRVYDKAAGRDVLYVNAPFKPNPYCQQRWWIATGGLEFCYPATEHGLNILEPWDCSWETAPDGSASITVRDRDKVHGLVEEVRIRLLPDRDYIEITPRLFNPNPTGLEYMFWINALVEPGPDTEIVFPTHYVIDWPPDKANAWPFHDGVDRSWQRNLEETNSIFPIQPYGNWGAVYHHERDFGIVRVDPGRSAPGMKYFTYGSDPPPHLQPRHYTDTGVPYGELMGGRTASFSVYDHLAPGQVVEWTEYWRPLRGMGGLSWANADLAVSHEARVGLLGRRLTFTLSSSTDRTGCSWRLSVGNAVIRSGAVDLPTGVPVRVRARVPKSHEVLRFAVADEAGSEILNFEIVLGDRELPPAPEVPPRDEGRGFPEGTIGLVAKGFYRDAISAPGEAHTDADPVELHEALGFAHWVMGDEEASRAEYEAALDEGESPAAAWALSQYSGGGDPAPCEGHTLFAALDAWRLGRPEAADLFAKAHGEEPANAVAAAGMVLVDTASRADVSPTALSDAMADITRKDIIVWGDDLSHAVLFRLADALPADPLAHFCLSISHMVRGQFEAAARELSAAVENDPGMALAWRYLAGLYLDFRLDDREKAAECAARALELDPDDFISMLILVDYSDPSPEEEARLIERAYEIDPHHEETLWRYAFHLATERKDYERALEYADILADDIYYWRADWVRWEAYAGRARDAMAAGDYKAAASVWEEMAEVLTGDLDDIEIFYQRAICLREVGDDRGARSLLEKAAALTPDDDSEWWGNVWGRFWGGLCYAELGDTELAAHHLTWAMPIIERWRGEWGGPGLCLRLAMARRALGQHEEAAALLAEFLQDEPENTEGLWYARRWGVDVGAATEGAAPQ